MPTAPRESFPFCGASYLAESPRFNASRAINMYPATGSSDPKSRMQLVQRPGVGLSTTLPGANVRSLWAGDNRIFAASGTHVYEVNSGGGVLTDYGPMAGSTGLGYCTWAADGTALVIFDSSAAQIYNVDPSGTPSCNLVIDGVALEYLDGFFVAIPTGGSLAGTNPCQINASDNLNPTSWNPLNYVIRTGSPDLPVGLAVVNSLLWIFGQKNTEIWYDAGTVGFPFARTNGGQLNIGCLAPGSIVKFQNSVMWLGGDDHGYSQVYMSQGMSAVRVSNPAIEWMLASGNPVIGYSPYATPLYKTFAYGYQEAGHTFYVLNLPAPWGPAALGGALVYDLTTGLWHERYSNIADSTDASWGLPHACCVASTALFGVNQPILVGDFYSGKVLQQQLNFFKDNGEPFLCRRTAPHVSDADRWITYNKFTLSCDVGTALPVLGYSNNGAINFLPWTYPLQKAQDVGAPETFQRFYAMQLGRSRDRVFYVDCVPTFSSIRFIDAYLNVTPGNET